MKNKSLLTAVTISTALFFANCTNKTNEICDCLKKAANTYMIKGEKAKEHDLMKMCNQFEGALKEASVDDKRKVETCLDSVKKHIEEKILFTDIEQASLSALPCGKDFVKELITIEEEKITKTGERKAMSYYLKGRVLSCSIAVDNAVVDYLTQKPNLYDGMLRVTGHFYDKGEILNQTIELLMPEKEVGNIKKAVSAVDVMKNAEYPLQDTYTQIIKFSGTFYDMPETRNGGILFMFKTETFEYIKPNPKTEIAAFNGQAKFAFDNSTKKEAVTESQNAAEQQVNNVAEPTGNRKGRIISEKSFFYETANLESIKKAYLIKDQEVNIESEQGECFYCRYTNENGKTTEGYLLKSSIEKL